MVRYMSFKCCAWLRAGLGDMTRHIGPTFLPHIAPRMASIMMNKSMAIRPTRASRSSVVVRAEAKDLWFPGAARPSYLNGTLAGDRGFDPMGLGADPVALKW